MENTQHQPRSLEKTVEKSEPQIQAIQSNERQFSNEEFKYIAAKAHTIQATREEKTVAEQYQKLMHAYKKDESKEQDLSHLRHESELYELAAHSGLSKVDMQEAIDTYDQEKRNKIEEENKVYQQNEEVKKFFGNTIDVTKKISKYVILSNTYAHILPSLIRKRINSPNLTESQTMDYMIAGSFSIMPTMIPLYTELCLKYGWKGILPLVTTNALSFGYEAARSMYLTRKAKKRNLESKIK